MKRYIDLDLLLEELNKEAGYNALINEIITRQPIAFLTDGNSFNDSVYCPHCGGNIPSVDVIDVVRCRDCVHYIEDCKVCRKIWGLSVAIPDFGCVFGKRK